MKIWTKDKSHDELDGVAVAEEFWQSEYGRVTGERGCAPLVEMLKLFLAAEYGMVLVNSRDLVKLEATAMHTWPEEWR